MYYTKADPPICVLTRDDYCRPGEYLHIQLSNELPGYFGIPHQHEFIEITYIISGTAMHRVGNDVRSIKAGDLYIINMNTEHNIYFDAPPSEPLIYYDLIFTPEFFDQSLTGSNALESLKQSFMFYSLFHEQEEYHPYFSVFGSNYPLFGELFNKIYMEYHAREKGYLELIRAYLLQLIISIFRMDNNFGKPSTASPNKQVCYVIDYIQQNYSKPISVQELADQVFLSRDYLGRLFRSTTGMSITEMIQKVRVERVCQLLKTTSRTINDIAISCGFNDMTFFYNVFKKLMGVLPNEYRNSKDF